VDRTHNNNGDGILRQAKPHRAQVFTPPIYGSRLEIRRAVAVDSSGKQSSVDGPAPAPFRRNPAQKRRQGRQRRRLVSHKLNSDGPGLVYSTYLADRPMPHRDGTRGRIAQVELCKFDGYRLASLTGQLAGGGGTKHLEVMDLLGITELKRYCQLRSIYTAYSVFVIRRLYCGGWTAGKAVIVAIASQANLILAKQQTTPTATATAPAPQRLQHANGYPRVARRPRPPPLQQRHSDAYGYRKRETHSHGYRDATANCQRHTDSDPTPHYVSVMRVPTTIQPTFMVADNRDRYGDRY